ncbi:MAG: DUF2730 domain-containing protein [Anaerotruncus sp.]|nr:DUF2730 domain-containing protein [Anaerotruncus sp.]
MNQYITTLGVYILAIAMIFVFESPAMIATLFLAYAITAFYQDLKVLMISNAFLVFAILSLIFRYPELLEFPNPSQESSFAIPFFFLVFVFILTISSFILVKQKRFFYNQIALSKENEFRNIDLLIDLQNQVTGKTIDLPKYYANVSAFAKAFSAKLQMENVFQEKIEILQAMENNTTIPALLAKYSKYTKEELEHLQDLLLGNHEKLMKLAMKISYAQDVHIKKREIFSETQFRSLNHQSDNLEIKILAFAVFYTALRRGSAAMRPLTEEEIYNVLVYTDYYYTIDSGIIRIYQENNKVFDDIVNDVLGKEGEIMKNFFRRMLQYRILADERGSKDQDHLGHGLFTCHHGRHHPVLHFLHVSPDRQDSCQRRPGRRLHFDPLIDPVE